MRLLLLQQVYIALDSTADSPIYTSITKNKHNNQPRWRLSVHRHRPGFVHGSRGVVVYPRVCILAHISSPVYPRRSIVGIA